MLMIETQRSKSKSVRKRKDALSSCIADALAITLPAHYAIWFWEMRCHGRCGVGSALLLLREASRRRDTRSAKGTCRSCESCAAASGKAGGNGLRISLGKIYGQ